jgi:acyl-CoA thioesterase FadM
VVGGRTEWSERFAVRAYEIGARGVVEPWAVCNWLQETAGRHVETLGWSIPQLGVKRQTWVLARLRLQAVGELQPGDEAVVSTWTAGASKAYAVREFRVEDGSGKPVALASSGWLLVDLATHRPLRPPAEIAALGAGAPRAIDDAFARLPDVSLATWSRAVHVGLSSLDMNRHANNVAIVTWLLDVLDGDAIAGRRLAELAVEFRAEARWADALVVEAGALAEPGRIAHRLVGDGGRELARAVTQWVET